MAKSARASSRKENNQKLKKTVFGPVETARAERLSAKLLEIAAKPKPIVPGKDNEMAVDDAEPAQTETSAAAEDDEAMDIDSGAKSAASKIARRKKVEKRRSKKSSVVFLKYKDRTGGKKKRR